MEQSDPLGGRSRVEVDSPRRALPLTQMQSEMLRASVQRVGSARPYQLQTTVELRCRLDLFQLRSNWTRLWSDHHVLRCPSHLAPHNALPEIEVVEGHCVKAAAARRCRFRFLQPFTSVFRSTARTCTTRMDQPRHQSVSPRWRSART